MSIVYRRVESLWPLYAIISKGAKVKGYAMPHFQGRFWTFAPRGGEDGEYFQKTWCLTEPFLSVCDTVRGTMG